MNHNFDISWCVFKIPASKQHRVFLDNITMCAYNMCMQTMHPHRLLNSRIATAAVWVAGPSPKKPDCSSPARCQLSASKDMCCCCLHTQTWPSCHHISQVCQNGRVLASQTRYTRVGRPAETGTSIWRKRDNNRMTGWAAQGLQCCLKEDIFIEKKEWVTVAHFSKKSTALSMLF